MELNLQQTQCVAAGLAPKNVIEAVSIAIQVYGGAAGILDDSQYSFIQATEIYAKLGRQLGEHIFDLTHPDPLGKMIYYPSDLKGKNI